MKRSILLLVAGLCAFVPLLAVSSTKYETEIKTVKVDFSQRAGIPLMKKFGLFNSGIVPVEQYVRDASLFDGLQADSLRIDLFMGKRGLPFGQLVGGEAQALTYDFAPLDTLVKLLKEKGVNLYVSWCYIPAPLQIDGDYRKGPSSLAAWREVFRAIAAHYMELGIRIPYNEIYNEPDCNGVFFAGTMTDYTQMYIEAAKGLLEGNSDAVIGGPSTAFIDVTGAATIRKFLDTVLAAHVPLDFFSYHSYGCDAKQYVSKSDLAESILWEYPELDTTELHLNEYNSLIQPFLAGGPAELCRGAVTMLTSFQLLLEKTDVTLAHWAQFMDTGYEPLGSISVDGRAKAAYWAYWMYSQMPEERVLVAGLGAPAREGLHAMASRDASKAALLIWNDSATETCAADLQLSALPFSSGECRVYEMDETLDQYPKGGDSSVKASQTIPLEDMQTTLNITLAPSAFRLYLFDGGKEMGASAAPGTLVRKRYYFPERGKSNYAFYDEKKGTVYLGMNGETSARSVVAMEYSDLPDMVQLSAVFGGAFEGVDLNTSFSIRVDYAVSDAYVSSHLYTFLPMNPRREATLPWGTRKSPDETEIASALLTGKTLLLLRSNAPQGWTGRAIYNMYSPVVYRTGDILDTLVYRIGLVEFNFSLSTAVGIFRSLVGLILIGASYGAAWKFAGYRIF